MSAACPVPGCIATGDHGLSHLYRCASPSCPGRPWRASDYPHDVPPCVPGNATERDDDAESVAVCLSCRSEETVCDEDRCCLTCGSDLAVCKDRWSAEVVLAALEQTAALLDFLADLDDDALALYGLRADSDGPLDAALFAWRRAGCPR